MAELHYYRYDIKRFFYWQKFVEKLPNQKTKKEVNRENLVTEPEFIKRCYNVILLFENDIENKYIERKDESEFIETTL
jgi:hypothetical protein